MSYYYIPVITYIGGPVTLLLYYHLKTVFTAANAKQVIKRVECVCSEKVISWMQTISQVSMKWLLWSWSGNYFLLQQQLTAVITLFPKAKFILTFMKVFLVACHDLVAGSNTWGRLLSQIMEMNCHYTLWKAAGVWVIINPPCRRGRYLKSASMKKSSSTFYSSPS